MKNIFFTLIALLSITTLQAQVDRTVVPQPGPAPEINLKSPTSFELPNGLKVLIIEDHKLPRVSYSLTLDNPPIAEGEKTGVSTLTSRMLGQGTQTISKDDFNEEVDFLGARISIGVNSAFATGLSRYSDRILELMSDAAINPNFKPEYFEDEKKKLIEGLKTSEKDVSQISNTVSNALAYGKAHPKGEFVTEESVNRVALNDVIDFYQDQFAPSKAYLVVVGDVEYEAIKKKITDAFSTWKKASPLSLTYSKPSDAQYRQINFVDMPNAVQSEIKVQNLVELKMSDPDYFPVILANYILGGGSAGRLFKTLREEKGYTYGAYSSIGNDKYNPSLFRAGASVRNEVTDSAVIAFLEEIDNFIEKEVSNEELRTAKAKYTGNFVMALEDSETMANLALNIEVNDLSKDFYRTYLEQIDAVTREDISRVAKKYLNPGQMRIVVVGKGSEVIPDLEKLSYKGRNIPIFYYDKKANKTDKPEFGSDVPEGVTIGTVLNNYIQAVGGKAKLEDVASVFMTAKASMQGMNLDLEIKKAQGKFLVDTKMQGNSLSKQVFTGDSAFVISQGRKQALPKERVEEMRKTAMPFPELEWLDSDQVSLEGISKIGERDAYVVKVSDNQNYYYDVETGLKLREESTVKMGQQTMLQQSNLSDYQDVKGVMFPFKMTQTVGPQEIEMNVVYVKINEGISDSDFQ
ncbi:insulinase family protein [Robertkochia aurantiaca]|uniref:insulinase family protein n=1 Tax=Robertkochia aurantiaca TaxID=2873700 RepID=UPI001CCD4DD4|nr:insulinase family protein [Robertkochia sp. 3YJGBD-33]